MALAVVVVAAAAAVAVTGPSAAPRPWGVLAAAVLAGLIFTLTPWPNTPHALRAMPSCACWPRPCQRRTWWCSTSTTPRWRHWALTSGPGLSSAMSTRWQSSNCAIWAPAPSRWTCCWPTAGRATRRWRVPSRGPALPSCWPRPAWRTPWTACRLPARRASRTRRPTFQPTPQPSPRPIPRRPRPGLAC